MKIERVETFQADAGWRMFSFLKVTTDDGIIGWSEFNESFGSIGLSDVIRGLVARADRHATRAATSRSRSTCMCSRASRAAASTSRRSRRSRMRCWM